MDIRSARGARGRTLACVVIAGLAMGACDSEPVGPETETVELRVTGTAESYTGGTARLAGEEIPLERGIVDIRGRFDGGARRVGTLVLDLWKGDPVPVGAQTTQGFDRFELAVDFDAGTHEVDLSLLPALSMLRLARPDLAVEMVDDPCVLDARVLTSVARADTDRVLYQGSFQNIVAVTFARDNDYRGGNLFDDGDPRTEFAAACQTDVWDLSDAVVCAGDGQRTDCVFHLWGDPDGLRLRDAVQ